MFIKCLGENRMNIIIKTQRHGDESVFCDYEYMSETTFGDFLKLQNINDYIIDGKNASSYKYIKYIISKETNSVLWNVPFDKVKIIDYVNTYSEVPTIFREPKNIGAAGFDWLEIWNRFIEVLPILFICLGYIDTCVDAYDNMKRFKNYVKKTDKECEIPFTIYTLDSFIFSRDKWNVKELSELLRVEKDIAEFQLKARGYEYDRHYQMYVLNMDKKHIYDEMIQNISKFDNKQL